MVSEQFILEMYAKLHPDSDVPYMEDLTGAEVAEIIKIVDDKHSITLSSKWIPGPDRVTVDMRVLRNMMVSAGNHCYAGLKLLNAQTVGDMDDGHGRIDPDMVTKWEGEVAYYQDQLDAIKKIEQLLEALVTATNREGFYVQGVTPQ